MTVDFTTLDISEVLFLMLSLMMLILWVNHRYPRHRSIHRNIQPRSIDARSPRAASHRPKI